MKTLSLFLFIFLANVAMADSHEYLLENNGIQVILNSSRVTSINVDGNPFSEKSEFFVVKPAWAGSYYTFSTDTQLFDTFTSETKSDGSIVATLHMNDKKTSVVIASQSVTLTPDRKVIISNTAKNTSSCQALLEHNICDITPGWFSGRQVEIVDKDGKKETKHLPFSMTTNEREACKVASGFSSLKLKSRLGDINFNVTGNTPITLLDYRMAPYLEGKSQIWLGVLSYDFPPDSDLNWSVGIQFPAKREFKSQPAEVSSDAAQKCDKVFKPKTKDDLVIPTPKSIKWHHGNIDLSEKDIVFSNSTQSESVVQYLLSEIKRDTKLDLSSTSDKNATSKIKLVLSPDKEMKPEGYTIDVKDSAELEAQTTVGLMNASRTLLQLLRFSTDERQWSIRKVSVDDWPVMSIRAVEFYTGKDAGKDQKQIVSDLMGRFKMNMLIHHINYAEWKSRPDLRCDEIAMSKDDLKMVFNECLRQNIEYVPFFPAYGLLEWLRFKTNHPKSLNLKASVWNDPDEMSAIESIFTECINEFHPRYLHIGHDELYDASSEDLIASIKYWHKWLKSRNVKTMIWSDLFLTKGDAADAHNAPTKEIAEARRKELPKDIIITDWHYDPMNTDYKSLAIFNNDGFDTIASNWFDLRNIFLFGKAAAKETIGAKTYKSKNDDGTTRGQTLGQLATTWAGWNFNRKAMDENMRQLAECILTAESAWVGGYNDPSEVPFDILPVFFDHWQSGFKLPEKLTGGWTVDLSSVANLSIKAEKGQEWLGFPKDDNISSFPTGQQWLNNSILFNIPKDKCVLFNGILGDDIEGIDKLVIPVNQRSDTVVFALAATLPYLIDIPIADTVISYTDGTSDKIDWRVAYNIFSIDDMRVGGKSPMLYKGRTAGNDKPFGIHSYVWTNPHPDKTIKEIVTTSKNLTSSMMLFGVTGIENENTH